MAKIQVTVEAGSFVFQPAEFLGGDLFGAYRAATAGARFDSKRRAQVTSDKATAARVIGSLATAGFVFTVESAPAVESAREGIAALAVDVAAADLRAESMDAALRARGLGLFGYQRDGVRWLAGRSKALLADDMGLGKTVQVLAALPADAAVLVVGPAVAKGVWRKEAAKWRPDFRVSVLSGRSSFRWPAPGEIVVTNYDVLSDIPGDAPAGVVVVADEAHAVKSYKAKRSKRFVAISKAAQAAGGKVWLLTATPMLNRPNELFSVLSSAGLVEEAFGGWKGFCSAFGGHQGSYGMEWSGPDATVAEKLQKVSLRRVKTAVLKDLPAKRHAHVEVESTFSVRDRSALDRIAEVVGGVENIESAAKALAAAGITFEQIAHARALLAASKIDALLSLVEEYEEAGEPLVVFSAHRAPVDALGTRAGWAVISGDTSPEERSRIEADFQAGNLRGVAATIKAGGVAITLTKASNAIFVDQDWTPALNSQAEDRIYRIGQDRAVLVTILVANHVLDARVSELLASKSALLAASTDAAAVVEAPSSVPTIGTVVFETVEVEAVVDPLLPAVLDPVCPF